MLFIQTGVWEPFRVRRSLGKEKTGQGRAVAPGSKKDGVRRKVVDRRVSGPRNPVKEVAAKSFSRKVVVRKGPNAPVTERRTVKVQNVPYDLTWKDVKDALSEVGKIERCDVDRGEATIVFGTQKDAARAVQNYNGGDMNGRKIRVMLV